MAFHVGLHSALGCLGKINGTTAKTVSDRVEPGANLLPELLEFPSPPLITIISENLA